MGLWRLIFLIKFTECGSGDYILSNFRLARCLYRLSKKFRWVSGIELPEFEFWCDEVCNGTLEYKFVISVELAYIKFYSHTSEMVSFSVNVRSVYWYCHNTSRSGFVPIWIKSLCIFRDLWEADALCCSMSTV